MQLRGGADGGALGITICWRTDVNGWENYIRIRCRPTCRDDADASIGGFGARAFLVPHTPVGHMSFALGIDLSYGGADP